MCGQDVLCETKCNTHIIPYSTDCTNYTFWNYEIFVMLMKVKLSLGGITRNHLKEWVDNQKQPNHFLGSFTLNVFTIINYYFLMFINCMH